MSNNKKFPIIKILFTLAILGGIGFTIFYLINKNKTVQTTKQIPTVQTMKLRKTSVINSISTSGTIYSNNVQNVYTTLSYPIQSVNVKIGDKVNAGDVLATLDLRNLNYDIQQAQINLQSAKENIVETEESNVSSVKSAEISVETAKLNLDKQQLNLDNLKEQYENNSSTDLIKALNEIDSAKNTLESAQRDKTLKKEDYDKNKLLFDSGVITQDALNTAETTMENANVTYENALSNYDKAVKSLDQAKETLSQSIKTAETEVQNAKLSYENAQNSLEQAKGKSTTTSTIQSQQISLEKLQQQQSEGKLVAPISGTITAVNAVVGSNPSGILFTIEDMNDLYVSTKVKEYNINVVKIGSSAIVTTDTTGNERLNGKISFISPKAVTSTDATNVEYEVYIKLDKPNENLRLGMNAYASIILEQKDQVFAVPIDAIVTKRGEGSFVYSVENNIIKEIPVTTGLENDTVTEISGDAINEDLRIVISATEVTTGEQVEAQDMQNTFRQNRLQGDTNNTPTDRQPNSENNQRPTGAPSGEQNGGQGMRQARPSGN